MLLAIDTGRASGSSRRQISFPLRRYSTVNCDSLPSSHANTDGAFQSRRTSFSTSFSPELSARPRHGAEIHSPEPGFLAHHQAEFVGQIDDMAVVRIVDQPHVVRAQRLDAAHVLFHLRARERVALVLPQVVPANTIEHDAFAVQLEPAAADRNLAEAGARPYFVGARLGAQHGRQLVEVRLPGRPQRDVVQLEGDLYLRSSGHAFTGCVARASTCPPRDSVTLTSPVRAAFDDTNTVARQAALV